MASKHFEINLKAGRTEFTYKCSTAFEALEAIENAVNSGMISSNDIDFDDYMYTLIRMLHEGFIGSEDKYFRIVYVDGEV